MDDELILVNEQDEQIGSMGKLEVHQKGLLHRAFSIFIFNSKSELLLQQRAADKYHSGGLWTNTCCSHPRSGESIEVATHRRLREEMGMKCDLQYAFPFTYRAEFDNGLIEFEYDHVFVGRSDYTPEPNPMEVQSYKYVTLEDLALELEQHPDQFTQWLKVCFVRVMHFVEKG